MSQSEECESDLKFEKEDISFALLFLKKNIYR